MNFSEVLNELKNGKKISRPVETWRDMYIVLEDSQVICYMKAVTLYSWNVNIMLSNDWIICDEKINCKVTDDELVKYYIPFDEAINALKEGKKVKLSNWKDKFISLDINKKDIFVYHYVAYEFSPTLECFLSEDWEVIE